MSAPGAGDGDGDTGSDPLSPPVDPATFSSGAHGTVAGKRGALRRAGDRALDAWLGGGGARRRIAALAATIPPRDVLVVSLHGPEAELHAAALAELRRSRHQVRFATGSMGELTGGKFQNANALLEGQLPADWVLVMDDDVSLPAGFLDGFVALCERLRLDLAQPAQTLASHAAWRSARRVPLAIARQTNFVEIGPLTAFSRRAAGELLPFPDLRMGWGLDLHWAALAAQRGWRLGVIDALPVRHETRPVGRTYASAEASEEAQRFLAGRPYLDARRAGQTLRMHRRVPR
jgi:hypothetical protein